jgi:hypothetical protein
MEIAAMKRANLDTQHLLTTKTTPAQTKNDHRTTAHSNAMTKPPETLFDGTPENWPAFNIVTLASQLYKLYCFKKKLKNCLTTDLTHDIEASMPTGLSNNDGRIYFIKLVSHTFPDKEAHKRII